MKAIRKVRSGFTLIELLVVVGILALLSALGLMGVQAVRERARAAHCQNNLRQISIGVASYESVYRTLPGPTIPDMSVFVTVLPFMDQAATYDALNFMKFSGEEPNNSLLAEAPHYHRCPSDTDLTYSESSSPSLNTSYLASRGTAWLASSQTLDFGASEANNGVFSVREGGSKYSHIFDGLSNTIALAEFAKGTQSNRLRQIVDREDWQNLTISAFDQLIENATATTFDLQIGSEWRINGVGSAYYLHYLPPGRKSAKLTSLYLASYSPSSNHGGITHVAKADGSITPVGYSIDRAVWVQLGDIQDGGSSPF